MYCSRRACRNTAWHYLSQKNQSSYPQKDFWCNFNYFRCKDVFYLNLLFDCIAGFLTGIAASMGLGGGMILIVYLTAFASVSQLEAQGINLIFFIPIAILSLIIHTKNKLVEWKTIIPTLIIGIAGAVLGSYLADILGSHILSKIFSIFITLIGIRELFTKPQK